jgi:O-antigen/teichoic acid export membrane protein
MLAMILQLGVFITIHAFIWAKDIVLVWLGSEYEESVPIMKIIILSLGTYLGYVVLRSIVDAVEVRAINTINLLLSLAFAIIISVTLIYVGFGTIGLAIGTTMGFIGLGVLTCFYLMRRYSISSRNFMLQWVILLNVLFAVIILVIKHFLASHLNQLNLLITGLLIEAILFSCYLYFFHKKKVRWTLELKKRIFGHE